MKFSAIGDFAQLTFAVPDIVVGLSLISLIITKVIFGEKYSNLIFPKLSIALSGICLLVTLVYNSFYSEFYNSLFIYNYNLSYIKSILLSCFFIIFLTISVLKIYKLFDSSVYIFLFGIINSIMISLSANNFLSLLLCLELYSFSVCFLLVGKSGSTEKTKNSVRFLMTSAIMTGVMFFGMSLLYSQFGSLSFSKIHLNNTFASIVGSTLIVSGLLFKLGAAPFHSWAVDIYEKASTSLVMFFDTIWKFFMVIIFIRVLKIEIEGDSNYFRIFFTVIALLSMFIGAVMPIWQTNIKKFIAYSAVGHIGFVTAAFAAIKTLAETSVVVSYVFSYCVASILFFSVIMILKKFKKVETFSDLSGLIRYSQPLGYSLVVSMFAMVGMPPFINFLAKLNVLKQLVESENYLLLFSSIAYSVLSLFYVGKYVRYVFRENPNDVDVKIPTKFGAILLTILIAFFVLGFFYSSLNEWFYSLLKGI